jgi:hypothetical protein
MITPFLVIYLIGTEHLSITVSGVLATTMLFIQRGGTFASGIVSDRYTPKAMLVSTGSASWCYVPECGDEYASA